MLEALQRFVQARPRTVLLICAVCVVVFGGFGTRVEKDNSMANIVPDDDPVISYYRNEFSKYFQSRGKIVVGVFDDETIYNPRSLAKVERITRAFQSNPKLQNVVSLSAAETFLLSDEGMLDVEPVMPQAPADEAGVAEVRRRVEDNRFVRNGLVSKDGKATLVVAMPTFEVGDSEASMALYTQIEDLLAGERGPEKVIFAGFPVAIGMINHFMTLDMTTMVPLVILVMTIILFLSFRSLRGVVIPMSVVGFSAICTFGFMGLTGTKITVIGTSIPIVMVAIGVADGIHILGEYYWQLRAGRSNAEAVRLTMEELASPVMLTSVTTTAGFFALAASKIVPIREYGVFVGIGVMVAMMFSLCFIPAVLLVIGKPKRLGAVGGETRIKLLDRMSRALGHVAVRRAPIVLVGFLAMLAATIYLTSKTVVSHNTMEEFKEGTSIRVADRLLNEHFGGTSVLAVALDTGRPDGVKDPAFLAKVAAFQKHLLEHPAVGFSESLADYIREMHRVMRGGGDKFDRLPGKSEQVVDEDGETQTVDGRQMVAQFLLLYEMAGGSEIGRLVDGEYRRTLVLASVRSFNSVVLTDVMRHVREFSDTGFGPDVDVNFAGNGYVQLEIVHLLVDGQIRSLMLSFAVVFLVLLVIFRSLRFSFLGIIPLFLTVLLNFSTMVVAGIPLNIGTALIASICIGIGVDYGIHFIHRFRLERSRDAGLIDALDHTMDTVGRAIILNALAVGLGFAVLVFSNFVPIINLGILMPMMMLASAFGAMIIIPTIISLTAKKDAKAQTGQSAA
ncbi:MAG: RND family transporter [Deltaproteobacteria bacterium]|nr:RND family transporter [Deltaproteobacteria bacterium]